MVNLLNNLVNILYKDSMPSRVGLGGMILEPSRTIAGTQILKQTTPNLDVKNNPHTEGILKVCGVDLHYISVDAGVWVNGKTLLSIIGYKALREKLLTIDDKYKCYLHGINEYLKSKDPSMLVYDTSKCTMINNAGKTIYLNIEGVLFILSSSTKVIYMQCYNEMAVHYTNLGHKVDAKYNIVEAPILDVKTNEDMPMPKPKPRAKKASVEAPILDVKTNEEVPKPKPRAKKASVEAPILDVKTNEEAPKPKSKPRAKKASVEAPVLDVKTNEEAPKPKPRAKKASEEAPVLDVKTNEEVPKPKPRAKKASVEAPILDVKTNEEAPKPKPRAKKASEEAPNPNLNNTHVSREHVHDSALNGGLYLLDTCVRDEDNNVIYKCGKTDNYIRRFKEHEKAYGKIKVIYTSPTLNINIAENKMLEIFKRCGILKNKSYMINGTNRRELLTIPTYKTLDDIKNIMDTSVKYSNKVVSGGNKVDKSIELEIQREKTEQYRLQLQLKNAAI